MGACGRKGDIVKKAVLKHRPLLIFLAVICAIETVHFILYLHFGIAKAQDYRDNFILHGMDIAGLERGELRYAEFIPYDDLSLRYKNSISKDALQNTETDEECLLIYNKIIQSAKNPGSTSFFECTTQGMQMGTGSEVLTAEGKNYHIEHDICIRTNYFTFKPYISKWIISIEGNN